MLLFQGCKSSTVTYSLEFKSPNINDTLFYQLKPIPYKVDTFSNTLIKETYLGITAVQKDSLFGLYQSVFFENDSIVGIKDLVTPIFNKKKIKHKRSNTWVYSLFFNLPIEEVYENYKWDLDTFYSFNNIHKKDYTYSAKGFITKITRDSLETYVNIEYKINATRDVNGQDYPEMVGGYLIKIKDKRAITAKGIFLLNAGRWQEFKITREVNSYFPKSSYFKEISNIQPLSSRKF
jgi:hypothetical protein